MRGELSDDVIQKLTQVFIEANAELLFWNMQILERLSHISGAAKSEIVYY